MCAMLVDEAVRPFYISQILSQLATNVLGEVIFEYPVLIKVIFGICVSMRVNI
jgi:hypothetical protein